MTAKDDSAPPRTDPSPDQHAGCAFCQARERTEWCGLDRADVKTIDEVKSARTYMPGDVLYHQGDSCAGVYCVRAGLIGLRKLDHDGNSALVRLAYAGDTIGYRSFLAGETHHLSAEVLKPSRVCFIEQATARRILEGNPALGLRFLRHATRDLDDAEDKFLQSTNSDIRMRMAHLLFILKDRFATENKDGRMTLELPLSRQDMAAMIGVRPETMSRAIRKLEDDGLAFFSGRTVRVPDTAALFAEIEFEH
ncbi:MAG: Crp/Fnr family transcriptional regulator [Alphaproteobacteria bacterium]|nr:Crp/Fnr family transcriptional regulator [Alphaproteobacteria bacterium]